MILLLKKLAANRNLLKNLVVRDLKHRYVGSIGGFVWSVVHPLVLLISYSYVFTAIFQERLGPEFGTDSFAIFLLCGLLPWILFSDTLTRNCSVISDNAPLITKTVIPAEMLPISITLSNLVHHAIGMAILIAIMASFYTIHLSAFWIFLYMTMLLLFAQGLGWILAGLHVFLRDTIQALHILLFLWFWFTPILYSVEKIPTNLRFLTALNPMAVIITGYRNSLLHLAQPSLAEVAAVLAASLLVFLAGAALFKQAKPAFPDVL